MGYFVCSLELPWEEEQWMCSVEEVLKGPFPTANSFRAIFVFFILRPGDLIWEIIHIMLVVSIFYKWPGLHFLSGMACLLFQAIITQGHLCILAELVL